MVEKLIRIDCWLEICKDLKRLEKRHKGALTTEFCTDETIRLRKKYEKKIRTIGDVRYIKYGSQ